MRRRWILSAAVCLLIAFSGAARAGGLAPIPGPLDPGNILQTLNQLIVNINAQILASGTGSLASAISIPLVPGATPGSDNALTITPSAAGSGQVTLAAGGVDTSVGLFLDSQGPGDVVLFPGGSSTPAGNGLVRFTATSVIPAGNAPMTLGNALQGYGPMGVSGPPAAFIKLRLPIGFAGALVPVALPVWAMTGPSLN